MSLSEATPTRALVFGISGATWDVAAPLVAAGRLPNLSRLMETGCIATLRSLRSDGDRHYRPQVAWVTVATGCLPVRHGVTAFYHTAEDCRAPSLWHAFEASGRSVGLFGWPITWPPEPLNGFVIPCYHARDDATWPAALASVKRVERQQHEARRGREAAASLGLRELAELSRNLWTNGVRFPAWARLAASAARVVLAQDAASRSLALRHGKLELSAQLFLHLYRTWRPHLGTFHSFLVDTVSHRYWRFREPSLFGEPSTLQQARLATAVDDAYISTDQVLGRILREVPRDTLIAVLSEHGMAAEPRSGEVGQWQYLIRGRQLAELIGLGVELVDSPIARWVSYRPHLGQSLPIDAAIRLRRVHVAETGLPLFSVHEHGSAEIIVKFSIRNDVPRYREGKLDALSVAFDDRRVPFTAVARQAGRQRSAMHDERGMLVLSGPGIRRGATVPDCSITDFAPTLLAATGLPTGGPFDGRVLDVFE